MAETTAIKRAHEWVPPKRDTPRALPRCRICGAVKRPGIVTECYVEEVQVTDGETSET